MGTSASMAGGILTISGGILTALTGTGTATMNVNVYKSVLRIRDVYPGSGSRFQGSKAPDPGSGSATLIYTHSQGCGSNFVPAWV
jgi:hypothetical protein